ncbi:C40 family peptidase [Streptomyces meridianus]|uniref:C40 family peptidase n=1 Tax=Streptomyces meridianus TaxID=2938945 RepID=A0ABT0X765_9ACTN|nr:C40 family peptidase [Streptomyces meridianus]MCM2578362.1 C40 family peptidase [Streptomyces meridianus]
MSQTAHIPSRRKPRRTASAWIVRTGVAGGVLSTFAVTGAAASANAAEPAQKTVEMPAVAAAVANASAQSTAATAQAAADYEYRSEIRSEQAQAALTAKKAAAKKARTIAERKAEAKAKAAAAAAERASRSAARTTLSGTGSAASVLSFLQAQVGKAYVMGASGPSAYDCSGLTLQAFKTAGVNLPRTSQDQSTTGTAVSVDSLQPGDLIFWGGTGSAYHVGVYVGGGQYIDAANPDKGVVKQNLDDYPPTSARRVL